MSRVGRRGPRQVSAREAFAITRGPATPQSSPSLKLVVDPGLRRGDIFCGVASVLHYPLPVSGMRLTLLKRHARAGRNSALPVEFHLMHLMIVRACVEPSARTASPKRAGEFCGPANRHVSKPNNSLCQRNRASPHGRSRLMFRARIRCRATAPSPSFRAVQKLAWIPSVHAQHGSAMTDPLGLRRAATG